MTQSEKYVYDFIVAQNEDVVITTNYISETLDMQRTNVSAILNKFVKMGYLEKIDGRPVVYRLNPKGYVDDKSFIGFENYIGYENTNRNAVQLAKAVLHYLNGDLSTMIVGQGGSGISYFVHLMAEYAVTQGILPINTQFKKFNCRHYADDTDLMMHELFENSESYFSSAKAQEKATFLFIDHIEYLPVTGRSKLLSIIDGQSTASMNVNKEIKPPLTIVLSCASTASDTIIESFTQKVSVCIELAPLKLYSLEERFQMINHFFALESLRINRKLSINSELLVCLLLYECEGNIKQLRTDIMIGCANAYVRDIQSDVESIPVFVSDFNNYVRKGFLNYKNYHEELHQIIPNDYSYTFDGITVENSESVKSELQKRTIYDDINDRVLDLTKRGIEQNDINLIISAEFETIVSRYTHIVNNSGFDTKQLSKIVDQNIIDMVQDFLDRFSRRFDVEITAAVFSGLCIHINETLSRVNQTQTLSNEQIMNIIENNKKEYLFCLEFVTELEELWKVKLPIDEVIFIMSFILQQAEDTASNDRPVVLIAMHGDGIAHAISSVVQTLTKSEHVFYYDLPLEQEIEESYLELKEKIIQINQNHGVLVLYDMGSIVNMCEMIEEETGISIRMINVPITMIAIDLSRKVMLDKNIDTIHQNAVKEIKNYFDLSTKEIKTTKPEAIVTVCTTGEGSALQLKNYIKKYNLEKDYKVINIGSLVNPGLYANLVEISKQFKIKAIIGAVDPKFEDVPFIPINQIFEIDGIYIKDIIEGNLQSDKLNSNLEVIYAYLDEQLEHVNVQKLKSILPDVMSDLNDALDEGLSLEQKMGLLVHISCAINRLIANEVLPANIHKDEIVSKYKDLFNKVSKSLKSLEKTFKVIFTDHEVTNIIAIMKKL